MTCAVVPHRGDGMGRIVLPWVLHIEVKTLCWGKSHCGLLRTALSVAHANMQAQSQHHQDDLLLHQYKSKELGYDLSWPGPSFWPGKTQGGGKNEQNTALLSASVQHTYLNIVNKLKSKRGRNRKSYSSITLLCNCKQAVNFFVSWFVNEVSGFCSMGIYWCLLLLKALNCKVLLDIWLLRCFRNALNYTQL